MFSKKRYIVQFTVGLIIERDGRGYHAYCPALKGLHIDGKTKTETLSLAKQAIRQHLETLIEHNCPIPIGIVSFKEMDVAPPMSFYRINTKLSVAECRA